MVDAKRALWVSGSQHRAWLPMGLPLGGAAPGFVGALYCRIGVSIEVAGLNSYTLMNGWGEAVAISISTPRPCRCW